MKIKIIKCEDPTFWYADHVGEIFDSDGFRKSFNVGAMSIAVTNFILNNKEKYPDGPFVSLNDCVEVTNELEYLEQQITQLTKRIEDLEKRPTVVINCPNYPVYPFCSDRDYIRQLVKEISSIISETK
jgi:hypothetical protein